MTPSQLRIFLPIIHGENTHILQNKSSDTTKLILERHGEGGKLRHYSIPINDEYGLRLTHNRNFMEDTSYYTNTIDSGLRHMNNLNSGSYLYHRSEKTIILNKSLIIPRNQFELALIDNPRINKDYTFHPNTLETNDKLNSNILKTALEAQIENHKINTFVRHVCKNPLFLRHYTIFLDDTSIDHSFFNTK